MYVSQEKNYVSIFIQETTDLTLTLEPNEKGNVGAIGKLNAGNPHYAVIFKEPTVPLLSTDINKGGDLDNELAYHMKEFFSGFNGRMAIGRVMGSASTTKVLEIKGANLAFNDATNINIFGANNIKNWQDTASVEPVEVVVNACFTNKFTLEVVNVKDLLTVKVYNKFGTKIYSISGGAKLDSEDDYGVNNYIGNVVDNRILSIKAKSNHAEYKADFSLTKTFDKGIVVESGSKNYSYATSRLATQIEKCDYAITGGLIDTTAIQGLRAITYEAKTPLIVDIKGSSITNAKNMRIALNMNKPDICFIWNRVKNKFDAGNLNIGVSGYFVGQSISRNLSRLINGRIEYRVSAVGGVDYELPRVLAEEVEALTDAEKTELVDNRINSTGIMQGKFVITDALSGESKNISTRVFPVSEGNLFINRQIALIMEMKLFSNLEYARSFISAEVNILFDGCKQNNYFRSLDDKGIAIENQYIIKITTKDSDTVVVDYQYVPEGVMRRGVIKGTLVKKI